LPAALDDNRGVARERQKLEELGRRRSKIEEYLRDLQP
jgi:hypothetical protein